MDTKDKARAASVGRTEFDRDKDRKNPDVPDANRDPITGAPGSHPIGSGVGAAGGTAAGVAAGAAIGTAVLPGAGTVAGGIIGGVVGGVGGGLAGKGVAEAVNPTAEDTYWRENHRLQPYYVADYTYEEDYLPAYRYGWESRSRHEGRRFEDVESDLGLGWDRFKGKSRLDWDRAKMATRDAWHRVERAMPGDFDRDGR